MRSFTIIPKHADIIKTMKLVLAKHGQQSFPFDNRKPTPDLPGCPKTQGRVSGKRTIPFSYPFIFGAMHIYVPQL